MSGVAGGSRIERKQVQSTVNDFINNILENYQYYDKSTQPIISGSFQSDLSKHDFGDIDLLVNFNSDLDKSALKKDFVEFLLQNKTKIRPFESEKYKGKYYSNTGELVSILYPIYGSDKKVQIDVIFSQSNEELTFKQEFLNLPAEKQGLILGLMKAIILDEELHPKIFKILGLQYKKLESPLQEYSLTLSSVALTVELVTYEDTDTYKISEKKLLKKITNWDTILQLLNLIIKDASSATFEELLEQIKEKDWKSSRALKRIVGTFKSMISVKSGEVGTPKGEKKERAIESMEALLNVKYLEEWDNIIIKDIDKKALFQKYLHKARTL